MRPALLALALLLGGCCTLEEEFVDRDREDFDQARAMLVPYWEEDRSLDRDERARRMRWLDSWDARLEEAEHVR